MIAAGADVNREDEFGRKMIIQHNYNAVLTFYQYAGWTPLLKAIWARKEKLVELLLQNGADVNHELKSGQGWFGLYISAESGLKNIADMLISNGADVNKTIKATGWTPLAVSSLNGRVDLQ